MSWKSGKGKDKEELTDARLDITNRVLECMKQARDSGTEYKKGWFVSNEFPYNPVSGTKYSGVNVLSLLADGYEDPRFIPIGEVSKLFKETEGKVKIKKGEKASRIVFAKPNVVDTGEFDENGDPKMKSYFLYKYHAVFNVSQLEGAEILDEKYPRRSKPPMNDIQENEFVMKVAAAMESTGLKIEHHAEGKACYYPLTDEIKLPERNRFENEQLYNRTKLHEIGHATGHSSRCDRNQAGQFGSKDYAYEELVAELFSFYMGMETGLGYDRRTHENHGSYLNSWISAMTEDSEKAKNYIISAASKAFAGYDFVMDKAKELEASKSDEKKAEAKSEPVVEIEKKEANPVVRKKAAALAM